MKKFILLMMIICTAFSMPVHAKEKPAEETREIIGYKTKWKTKKVKVERKKYLGRFYITHYCPCSRCCGAGGGKVTASGTKPTVGRTVGVNPSLIPYGTKLKIGKIRGYVAEDTGGGIGWNHLDVFCASHQEALNAGVGWEKVWAITYKTKKKRVKIKIPIYEGNTE